VFLAASVLYIIADNTMIGITSFWRTQLSMFLLTLSPDGGNRSIFPNVLTLKVKLSL
jgi:hypothetical protein